MFREYWFFYVQPTRTGARSGELDRTKCPLVTGILGFHCAREVFRITHNEAVGILTKGLCMTHDLDISECPFDEASM